MRDSNMGSHHGAKFTFFLLGVFCLTPHNFYGFLAGELRNFLFILFYNSDEDIFLDLDTGRAEMIFLEVSLSLTLIHLAKECIFWFD